jgi:tryptophanyl-tRNA synthetase
LPFDNDGINLYRQSHIAAHSELTWILDCFTGYGQMARMTQFKDKAAKLLNSQIPESLRDSDEKIQENLRTGVSVGLFNYPVLMAADILLYNASYVPVGEDQTQHLEFTRDIAERMNSRFGQDLFVVPEPVKKQHEFFGKDQGLRIKDLLDPTKKMSKSDETGNGVIFLSDTPEAAKQKIMRATTDSLASVHYDKVSQPGIANLIDILALLRTTQPEQVAAEYEGMDRYGDFKQIVADEMAEFLAEFQKNLSSVDDEAVLAKLESSEAAMREQANETLLRVQKAVGLRV